MNPKDRIRRWARIIAVGTVVMWALLWYALALSPKLRKLDRLDQNIAESAKQLAEMRKEIEDAHIAGPPPTGASRFEKFGILGSGEEQLFLSDLIDLCEETDNTLNLVRRSEVARPAPSSADQSGQRGQRGKSSSDAPEVPRPTVERVPHTVSFSGTFLSSFHLLRRLEEYKRLLTVERMEVSTDHQLGHPRVNGNITIELYLVEGPLTPSVAGTGDASAPRAAAL